MNNVRAVLLDLDGTLVDSAADLAGALNKVLAQYERPMVERATFLSMVGDGIAVLVERGFAATGGSLLPVDLKAAQARCVELYAAEPTAQSCLYPGVRQTLAALKAQGYKLAVCTNKTEHISRRILADLEIDQFLETVVGGDTLGVRKPDPANLEGTLERLGVAKSAAVMVGDSRNDVLAARDADIPLVFANYGYNSVPLSELGVERVIDSFKSLADILGS